MRGVAFKNNAIHFNTAQITGRCTPRTRHFGHLLEEFYIARISILPYARPFITNFVADKVIELFPQSKNLIRHLQTTTEKKCRHYEQLDRFEEWDLAPSIHREAVAELLSMVTENPVFSKVTRRALSQISYKFQEDQNVTDLYSPHPKPWCLPSKHEVAALEKRLPLRGTWPAREPVRDSTRYYTSAASQAARFLLSLSTQNRAHIRNIELHEKHACIAYSECHARALIPYVVENPNLKVVRRVDLWNTVLASERLSRLETHRCGFGRGRTPLEDMERMDVTRSVVPWLMEASALASMGMPIKSFSLIFEGETNTIQPVFDMLIEDAIWQDALQQWSGHGIVSSSAQRNGTGYRSYYCYLFKGYPEMMKDVVNGTGLVSFEHCYAQGWDPERVLSMNSNSQGMHDWWLQWKSSRLLQYVAPPLPRTWQTILTGYLCQDENTAQGERDT
ncbi:unnamed protein product [Alternaria alternata]